MLAQDEVDDAELKEIEAQRAGAPASELERELDAYIGDPAQRNKTRIDKIARLMFNDARVRKICRVQSLRNGVDVDDVEEVLQGTMVIFFSKMLEKMRTSDAVYAVVYAVAYNVAREAARDAAALTFGHDSIEEMQENGEDLRVSDLAGREEEDRDEQVDTRISNQNKVLELKRLMQAGVKTLPNAGVADIDLDTVPFVGINRVPADQVASTAQVMQLPKKPRVTGSAKAARDLNPDQQELCDIIAKLAVRNQDFAVQLGIGLPRLSSYIYGRTASVPEEVMTRAREIFADQSKGSDEIRQKFAGPMSEILKRWAKRLSDISPQPLTNDSLGRLLGVTTMTIHRWYTDETKPDMTALTRYDAQVEHIAKTMESATAHAMQAVMGK
ncbi:hypothetical protein [Rubrivivax gelatinosus]|uniref:hypothetical protein n=1 Tax=Rubrivivax gelatinosus TaxID=28068 RepID=UPI00068085B3|nr:hypothetical protein [Rubrivivax gelatinosus]MBG6083209.1 DNA-binding transcriptional regulator YiaG [Rubrivivax gelatinosus]